MLFFNLMSVIFPNSVNVLFKKNIQNFNMSFTQSFSY